MLTQHCGYWCPVLKHQAISIHSTGNIFIEQTNFTIVNNIRKWNYILKKKHTKKWPCCLKVNIAENRRDILQVMACCTIFTKPLTEPMEIKIYGMTRPPCVKIMLKSPQKCAYNLIWHSKKNNITNKKVNSHYNTVQWRIQYTVPDGIKPILNYHQKFSIALIWEQFHKKCSWT